MEACMSCVLCVVVSYPLVLFVCLYLVQHARAGTCGVYAYFHGVVLYEDMLAGFLCASLGCHVWSVLLLLYLCICAVCVRLCIGLCMCVCHSAGLIDHCVNGWSDTCYPFIVCFIVFHSLLVLNDAAFWIAICQYQPLVSSFAFSTHYDYYATLTLMVVCCFLSLTLLSDWSRRLSAADNSCERCVIISWRFHQPSYGKSLMTVSRYCYLSHYYDQS